LGRNPDSSDGLFKILAPVFNRPVTIISRRVDCDQKREWLRYAITQNAPPANYETGWSVAGKNLHKIGDRQNVLSASHFRA
jgi:hypothetical protein